MGICCNVLGKVAQCNENTLQLRSLQQSSIQVQSRCFRQTSEAAITCPYTFRTITLWQWRNPC